MAKKKDSVLSNRIASYLAGLCTGLALCGLLVVIDAFPELSSVVQEYQIIIVAIIAFVIAMANRTVVQE